MDNQDALTPSQYAKMVGMFPDAPHNPLPTGGYMDDGFDWVVHQAESFGAEKFSKDKVVCIKCGIPSGFPHQLHELPSQVAGKHKYACRNCYNEVNDLNAETFGAESKSMFGKDKNGKMYARRRNGEIITHNAEYDPVNPFILGQTVWVRVETQKIEDNEGRLDSEIAGRVTGYFTSEFAALKDAHKRLAQYEAIPQRFMNDLTKSKSKITVISHLQGNTVNKIEYMLTERHGAESFMAEMDGEKLRVGSYDFDDGSMMVGIGTEDNVVDSPDFMEMMVGEDGKIDYFSLPIGKDGFQRHYQVKPSHYGKMKTQNQTNETAGGDFVRTDGDGKYAHPMIPQGQFMAETFNAECQACGTARLREDDICEDCETCLGCCVKEGFCAESFEAGNMMKPSRDWLSLALGTAAVVIGGSLFVQNRSMFKADGNEGEPSLVAHPSTGDLLPADYEEMIVESTGYAVPIIPISLDPAFMGSRFHALPTNRVVESNEPGIGAHTDVAMTRDTDFREPEQSMITRFNADGENCKCSLIEKLKSFITGKSCCEGKQVKEANSITGQTPYFGVGFDGKNTQTRVIKETNPVSLDPSTTSYIPQNLSGYTGQAYTPPTVYSDMMDIGVSGQNPAFVSTESSSLQSVHGNLSAGMNQSYTDGSRTMSLSQWSIDYDVSQTSDSEAFAVSRSSGVRTMIRRV